MFTVPPLTPVTMPVEGSTVAIVASPLLHAPPPGVVLLNVTDAPGQAFKVPVIAAGCPVILTVTVVLHEPNTYVIVDVPVPTPVTIPEELTVATAVFAE